MTEKPHTRIIVGSALLALAWEGWQGTIGESMAHSIGIEKSIIGLIVGTILGIVYSYTYEPPKPPHKNTERSKTARRPPKPH